MCIKCNPHLAKFQKDGLVTRKIGRQVVDVIFTGDSFIVAFGLLTVLNWEICHILLMGESTYYSVKATHANLCLLYAERGLYCLALRFAYSES